MNAATTISTDTALLDALFAATGLPSVVVKPTDDRPVYVWPDASHPLMVNRLWIRIDSRRANSGYEHRYAPLDGSPMGVDYRLAVWDAWDEMEPYKGAV